MRITRKILEDKIRNLNATLKLPATQWKDDGSTNPGHLCLDSNMCGYQLEQIAPNGGYQNLSGRMSAGDLNEFIAGMYTMYRMMTNNEYESH